MNRVGFMIFIVCVSLPSMAQSAKTLSQPVYTWERVSYFCADGKTIYVFTGVFPYCQVDTMPKEVVRSQISKVNAAAEKACTGPVLDVMVNGRDHPDLQTAKQDEERELEGASIGGSRPATVEITADQSSTRCAPRNKQ